MPSFTKSGSSPVLYTTEQMWSIINDYVTYLVNHNRTSDPESLLSSAHQDKKAYNSLLRSMLNHMAKHGMPTDFPTDGSIFEPTTVDNSSEGSVCDMPDLTSNEEKILDISSFWIEEVGQTLVGVLGVLGNLVAVAVYLAGGKKFFTIFYRLLICLLFTHTAYILLTLTAFFGRKFEW
jgi:hypothetical protein